MIDRGGHGVPRQATPAVPGDLGRHRSRVGGPDVILLRYRFTGYRPVRY